MEVDKKQKVCCRFPCCNAQVRNKGKDIKGEDKVLKFCSQHESAACREAPREPLSLPLAELLGEETASVFLGGLREIEENLIQQIVEGGKSGKYEDKGCRSIPGGRYELLLPSPTMSKDFRAVVELDKKGSHLKFIEAKLDERCEEGAVFRKLMELLTLFCEAAAAVAPLHKKLLGNFSVIVDPGDVGMAQPWHVDLDLPYTLQAAVVLTDGCKTTEVHNHWVHAATVPEKALGKMAKGEVDRKDKFLALLSAVGWTETAFPQGVGPYLPLLQTDADLDEGEIFGGDACGRGHVTLVPGSMAHRGPAHPGPEVGKDESEGKQEKEKDESEGKQEKEKEKGKARAVLFFTATPLDSPCYSPTNQIRGIEVLSMMEESGNQKEGSLDLTIFLEYVDKYLESANESTIAHLMSGICNVKKLAEQTKLKVRKFVRQEKQKRRQNK